MYSEEDKHSENSENKKFLTSKWDYIYVLYK